MSKKNFTGGLSSLLGEEPKSKAQDKAKTSSKKAAPLEEVRATFIVNKQTLEKLKAIAYWERTQIKNQIAEALDNYLEAYETKNGEVKPIPKK
jgi:hypothetical protein